MWNCEDTYNYDASSTIISVDRACDPVQFEFTSSSPSFVDFTPLAIQGGLGLFLVAFIFFATYKFRKS